MKVGFIGLGIMGRPMSKNLIKAGYEVVVNDFNRNSVADVVACGGEAAESNKEVGEKCDVVITMVQNSPQVRSALLGEGGVCEGAKPGTVVIDMSSIDPVESKKIGAELAEKGIEMLDAPVSGGEPKAIDGTLSIMCGGDEDLFVECEPILKVMGTDVVYCGAAGAGNTTKLANQIIVASNIAAVAEGFMLAKKAGVDPNKVYAAIRGGLAGSTVMDAKGPMMLSNNTKPGFKIDLHIKDLNNAVETGHAVGSPLPMTAVVMEILQNLHADGMGQCDHSAIAKFYEKLAKEDLF